MPADDSREIRAALDAFQAGIEAAVDSEGIPGVSVAVVLGQETLLCRGFGKADLESGRDADGDTVYRVASITKLFTATMLLMLRDEGKLGLDDPLAEHLPEVDLTSSGHDPRPVTLRQLASHMGGVPRDLEMDYFADGAFPTQETLIELAAGMPLRAEPMSQFKYSNVGMALLGYALERVAGMPYSEFVEDRILQPLGMESSGFDPGGAFAERGATGYTLRREGPPEAIDYFHCQGLTPAGQLHSTVRDLARFMAFQFTDGPAGEDRPLGGASLREMHGPVFLADDWGFATALGWVLRRGGDLVVSAHGGSLPGFVSRLGVARSAGLGIAVLSNAQTDGRAWSPDAALKSGFAAMGAALSNLRDRRKAGGDPTAPEEWRRYAGIYRMPFFPDVEVRIIGDSLYLARPGDKPGSEARLRHEEGHTFLIAEGPSVAEPVTFVVDGERCTGMTMPGGSLSKL